MNNVSLMQNKMTAIVGPGCTLGNADLETPKVRLVIPAGIVTSTGVARIELSAVDSAGCQGKWGLTCDHLTSVEVVTSLKGNL